MYKSEFERIHAMMQKKGVFTDHDSMGDHGTGKQYYTGYEYATLYDWDQYFETLIQLYLGWDTTYAKNGIEIFLDIQKENGHIQRSSKGCEEQLSEHVKPFLAQIALLIYNRDGNLNFLSANSFFYYERMKKYLGYWLFREENYCGLAFWDSAPHTGMDNQHERAGWWYGRFCCGVDLNSYLVRECRAFSLIAERLGRTDDSVLYAGYAEQLKQQMLALMWDDEDGFFYDIDRRTGKKIRVRYIGAFAPLWADIPSHTQAKSMIERYLFNPDEFNRGFLYPALSASEPGYMEGFREGDLGCCWRANTWIPTNYYVFEGLRRYGYSDAAAHLAVSTAENVRHIGDREYYATESVSGCGLDPFWGWSLLAYFMPYEAESGYDPTTISFEKNTHILL